MPKNTPVKNQDNSVPDKAKIAAQLVADRARLLRDKVYLAGILGYNKFQPDVHQELFDCLLQMKPGKILHDQDTRKNRLILWPRYHYKTTAIVVEIVQLILNFPDIAILLMQGTVKLGRGLLNEVKCHFTGDAHNSRLAEFFPEFCATKMGTAYAFTIPCRANKGRKEATLTIASAQTVKTSQHYDAGFFDDLVHEKNYRNPELLQKTIDEFNHYQPLIKTGYKYVTGTRYAFGDLYEEILRKNTETHDWIVSFKQCWTIATNGLKTLLFPQRRLADGEPVGFTIEELEQTQKNDPGMFAAQYLNQPVSTATQIFTEPVLLASMKSSNAEDFPYLGFKVLFIDLATSGANDDCVILCAQRDGLNRTYFTDSRGGRFTIPLFAQHVIEMALIHRPFKILIEKSAAGVVFTEYCRVIARDKGVYLPLDYITVNTTKGAKYVRVAALAGDFAAKRLFFVAGIPNWEKIIEQFVKYPKGHDDWADTVALAMEFFRGNQTPLQPIAHPIFSKEDVPGITQVFIAPPESSEYIGGSMGSFFED